MFRFMATTAVVLLLISLGVAQQKSTPPRKSSNKHLPSANSQPSAALPSEATVNEFLKHTFGYDPAITWKIQSIKPGQDPQLAQVTILMSTPQGQQVTTFYVTPGGNFALTGDMIPFGADPFGPARDRLQHGITGPSKGPMTAPVLLVEFSDLQCPHCKSAQPIIDRLLSAEPNARFVFQNYPLPLHNWAFKAASYADCVVKQNGDAVWKFIKAVYDSQENITESNADAKLTELASSSGVDGKAAAACAERSDTRSRIEQSLQLGREVDVNGTPTLFINGRKIANITGTPFETLKGIVDYEAKQGK